MNLQVLYQDKHLVAINKPSGLAVHRSKLIGNADEFALQLLRDQMQDLDQHFCGLYQQIQSITEDLTGNIEDRLISMGLSNAQESELMEILKEGNSQFLDLNDTSSELDNRFLHLEASLIEATLL